ncbi:hypothetical protein PGB90_004774 [Kerria lacca]
MKNTNLSNNEDTNHTTDTNQKELLFKQSGDRIRSADNVYTWIADDCVKLRNSYGIDEVPITIPMLFQSAVQKYANNSALATMEDGRWKMITFREYYLEVRTLAKAFLKLGLQRFHSVCILGYNSPEWFYSDLAAIMAGGIAAGIYTTNSSEACLHCLNISNAQIVVVQNNKQVEKILKIKDQAPLLKVIIQYSGKPTHPSVLSWEDIMRIGEKSNDDELDAIIETLAANECCTVMFTSGTTSLPKAVMLSHDNLIFKTKMTEKRVPLNLSNRKILSFLPLSHVAGQIFDLYKGLCGGICIYFADENALRNTIIDNLRACRPTEFLAVPRIWEKIKEHIENYVNNQSLKINRSILHIIDLVDEIQYENEMEGYDHEQLCAKVKDMVGLNEAVVCFSGAAPISMDIKKYLAHFGIRVGEILVDGRNIFMGYMNDYEKTKNAFDKENFFRTGDIGKYDIESRLRITGRIKDLIITSGGENIAPALIEFQVQAELPIISQAVLIGDGKKYLSLLITLKSKKNNETGLPMDEIDPETKSWYRSLGCKYDKVSEIITNRPSEVYNAIQEGINRANLKAISSAQKIQKFTILPREFSHITGELGPTTKLRRWAVYEKYKTEIRDMYSV